MAHLVLIFSRLSKWFSIARGVKREEIFISTVLKSKEHLAISITSFIKYTDIYAAHLVSVWLKGRILKEKTSLFLCFREDAKQEAAFG